MDLFYKPLLESTKLTEQTIQITWWELYTYWTYDPLRMRTPWRYGVPWCPYGTRTYHSQNDLHAASSIPSWFTVCICNILGYSIIWFCTCEKTWTPEFQRAAMLADQWGWGGFELNVKADIFTMATMWRISPNPSLYIPESSRRV